MRILQLDFLGVQERILHIFPVKSAVLIILRNEILKKTLLRFSVDVPAEFYTQIRPDNFRIAVALEMVICV